MDFDAVAGELYGLVPDDFTSTRTLRSREARREGDRAVATAISELRRPTIGAWLANQLARERPDELEELLGVGVAMRSAQEAEDGPELRRLSQQRRKMVTALVSTAKGLAQQRKLSVSENSSRELEDTLEAAVADADAADALRSGRLAVGLDYSGFGPSSAFGSAVPVAPSPTKRGSRKGQEGAGNGKAATKRSVAGAAPPSPAGAEPLPSQDQRAKLGKALEEAQSAVAHAEDQMQSIQQHVRDVEEERDRLRDEIDEIERSLRAAKGALQDAQQRLIRTQRAEKAVEKDVARAKTQRDKAQGLLERYTSGDS